MFTVIPYFMHIKEKAQLSDPFLFHACMFVLCTFLMLLSVYTVNLFEIYYVLTKPHFNHEKNFVQTIPQLNHEINYVSTILHLDQEKAMFKLYLILTTKRTMFKLFLILTTKWTMSIYYTSP
jgi:hypothetical protein